MEAECRKGDRDKLREETKRYKRKVRQKEEQPKREVSER